MSRQEKQRRSRGFNNRPDNDNPTGSHGRGGFSRSTLSYLAEPLDFSLISDPNIVVSFKNLLKKDATTKTKALDDLIAAAQARTAEVDGIEDAVLDVWVSFRPRTPVGYAGQ
jgi:E3 ubiquitin-protein ligase listerin